MIDNLIDTVTRHFLIAALWADCPENTRPRVTRKTEKHARAICAKFCADNEALFNEALERGSLGYGSHPDAGSAAAAFGHDLWLTIRGHGTGFWDREELENIDPDDTGDSLGCKLTAACEAYHYKLEPEFYRGWMYLNDYAVNRLLNGVTE